MARRRSAASARDEAAAGGAPRWWQGPAAAAAAWGGLAGGVPAVVGATLGAQAGAAGAVALGLSQVAQGAALPAAGLALVAGLAGSLRRQAARSRQRRLLDQQHGIGSIRALTWQAFEELVAEAYRRQGWAVELSGGGGADGGVDLRLTRGGERVLVQCKRWRTTSVGVGVVRELAGLRAHEGASGAVIVSSGRFTAEARDFAGESGIELVDGPALARLVEAVQSGARAPAAGQAGGPKAASPEQGAATRSEPGERAAPVCPQCAATMVLRRSRARPTEPFWGCSRYPACRSTLRTERAVGSPSS